MIRLSVAIVPFHVDNLQKFVVVCKLWVICTVQFIERRRLEL